jgi:hypothetical protein
MEESLTLFHLCFFHLTGSLKAIFELAFFVYSFKVNIMTCYFRHITRIFEESDIEVTKENKRDIDRIIHGMVGVDYKNCSAAWKEVKKRLADNEEAFIASLAAKLSKM